MLAALLRFVSSYARVGRIDAIMPDDNGRITGPPRAINLCSHVKAVSFIKGSAAKLKCHMRSLKVIKVY